MLWHFNICITSRYWIQLYGTFMDHSTHLGNLFAATDNAELCCIQQIRKCILSELFTLLVVLVLLWRDNNIQRFLFILHHRETLPTRLLSSFKKQDMCVKCAKGYKHSASVCMEEVVSAAQEAITKCSRKSVQHSDQQIWVQTGLQRTSAVMTCYCFHTRCSRVSHCYTNSR
jgi:hypothetical protein